MRTRVSAIVLVVWLLASLGSPSARARQLETPDQPGTMAAMLARLPQSLPAAEPAGPPWGMIAYSDYAAQCAAVGVDPPADRADPAQVDAWLRAVQQLPGWRLSDFAMTEAWEPAFGFSIFAVDQVVDVWAGDVHLMMLRGRFDPAAIRAAWQRNGYQVREATVVAGATVVSLGEDGSFDFGHPVQGMVIDDANNAALLSDGTLIYTNTRAAMEAVLDVAAGVQRPLTESPLVAALLDVTRPDLAGAVFVPGTVVAADPFVTLLEGQQSGTDPGAAVASSVAESSRMPPLAVVFAGTTAGGPLPPPDDATPGPWEGPRAEGVIAAVVLTPAQAREAQTVITSRLETQTSPDGHTPFTEMFPERSVQTAPDLPIVVVSLGFATDVAPGTLFRLLWSGGLSFLTW